MATSQPFCEQKCNLCKMVVRNIEVHMKLNHKKKKNKYYGFKAHSTLIQDRRSSMNTSPSLPNYSRKAEIHKSQQLDKLKKSKPVDENISRKLSIIGDHVHSEVMNFPQNMNEEDRFAFANVLKSNISNLKVDECPECKGLFQVNGKVATLEYVDLVGIDGVLIRGQIYLGLRIKVLIWMHLM